VSVLLAQHLVLVLELFPHSSHLAYQSLFLPVLEVLSEGALEHVLEEQLVLLVVAWLAMEHTLAQKLCHVA